MKFRKGFTLIEISAVIAIMAILTGMALANFNAGKRNQDLRQASLTLVDDVRRIQNMTFVGTTIPICKNDATTHPNGLYEEDCPSRSCVDFLLETDPGYNESYQYSCQNVVPPNGFGMFVDTLPQTNYTLYAELGSVVRSANALTDTTFDAGTGDTVISKTQLPPGVEISQIQVNSQFDNPGCTLEPPSVIVAQPVSYSNGSPLKLSMVWTRPQGILKASITPTYSNPCSDYYIKILLKQTKTSTCRQIDINGSSGLVDEAANESCAII